MLQFFEIFSENRTFMYLSIIVLISLGLFLFSWLKEPRNLINGLLFSLFLILLIIWLSTIIVATKLRQLIISYEIIILIFILLLIATASFSWLFFLWNAYLVWRHESHTLTNLLTFFLGIAIFISWVIFLSGAFRLIPTWLKIFLYAPTAIILYLLLVAYNFLVNLLLYQIVPRQYNQDYLIVLGSGLKNGKTVSPLLAARINRAIQFAQKQVAKGHQPPKFIMSGGKGNDEQITEAEAMKAYAILHGIDSKYILLETKSKNTYQNMQFSQAIATADFGNNHYRAKFFSNNYHIFRAGLDAKATGLNANGVGCYTRFYFLPNAIMREFAGILLINKKRHLIIIALITVLFIIFAFVNLLNNMC